MTIPVKQSVPPPPATIEDVITKGDLSKLTADQRTEYYIKLCDRHGLDPLTQPLDWLTLNGKLTLYANRRCADQLRKINAISIKILSQEYSDGLLTVHVAAEDKDHRQDEDLGAVYMCYPERVKNKEGNWVAHPKAGKPLEADDRANAILKAITKAKRRVTLSISGLGFLDETEVEDMPPQAKGPAIPPPTSAAAAVIEVVKQRPPQAGEPREIQLGDSPDWVWFGQQMIGLASTNDWPDWDEANRNNIARMENEAPKVHARMVAAIKKVADAHTG